jgi:hypothetical protein
MRPLVRACKRRLAQRNRVERNVDAQWTPLRTRRRAPRNALPGKLLQTLRVQSARSRCEERLEAMLLSCARDVARMQSHVDDGVASGTGRLGEWRAST